MLNPSAHRSQHWKPAVLLACVGLIGISVVPYAIGLRKYSPELFLNWLGFVAVLAAAALAADNLVEIRDARVAAVSPSFDVGLVRAFKAGVPVLTVNVTNLGNGGAAAFRALYVHYNPDGTVAECEQLEGLKSLFVPFQEQRAEFPSHLMAPTLGGNQTCDVLIRISYRDALHKPHVIRKAFRFGLFYDLIEIVSSPKETPEELEWVRLEQA